MHLLRIQVPKFQVLKDVDLKFEKDFTPTIFPLGSQNGGGKSTLLRLIFVLLHCAPNPGRTSLVENMLARYHLPKDVSHQALATLDIWDGNKTVQIEFLCCKDNFLKSLPSSNLQLKHRIIYSKIKKEALLCRLSNVESSEVESFLDKLSKKVFLASHYEPMLAKTKISLPNFFVYNLSYLPKTGELLELFNKNVPHIEDLSQGELKRLSIYAWIKHHCITDAIVLMDEIENALHPDWQYNMISDSYSLCEAVTRAHVKELD